MMRFYKKLSLLLVFLAVACVQAAAQVQVVKGTVHDENGEGMPGVNVILKGTSDGAATDRDGNFSISVPGPESVLVFSFVGYKTTEEKVGVRTQMDITIEADVQSLGEVVVMA